MLRNEQHTGLSLNDVKHKTSHTQLLNLVVYTIHTSRLYSVHAVSCGVYGMPLSYMLCGQLPRRVLRFSKSVVHY